MKMHFTLRFAASVILASQVVCAQTYPLRDQGSEVHLRIASTQPGQQRSIPAVLWLQPLAGTPAPSFVPHGLYTLLQKNRAFIPHLQVVPVGAIIQFPNADPFFHNVFSLFDGRRFDLGLYESGTSKSVTFSREGVSYIFCNIHPEMSAVVIAISSPYYSIADDKDVFSLRGIPPGKYTVHLWIEGVPQTVLDHWTHPIHLAAQSVDLGTVTIPASHGEITNHPNKFGEKYDPHQPSPYFH